MRGGIVAARILRLVASLQSVLRGILPLAVALAVAVNCIDAAAAPLASDRFESLHDNSDVPPPDGIAHLVRYYHPLEKAA